MKDQHTSALRVLQEVKEENSRMKRAFEQEKKLIADHVDVLNSEVKQLKSTLGDVNKTLSSIIPEIIGNFKHTKTEFLNILNITSRESVSVFSGYLASTLETTQVKLSNISSEFVQLGNAFNKTLGSVEENVKIGIDKSIKVALDDKINALENSLNSRFTNVLDNKINLLKMSINSEYTSALSTKMSDLKTYFQSAHTAVISSKVSNVESSIVSQFTNVQNKLDTIERMINDVLWTQQHLHYSGSDSDSED